MTRFAQDLPPGTVFTLGTRSLTDAEIVDFARQWDPQPFHVDPEAAAATAFGGLVASGIQTVAVAQRLLFDAFMRDTAVIAGLGVEAMRLPAPVRAGTVIGGQAQITGNRARPDGRAVVSFDTTLADQDDGRTLLTQSTTMLVQAHA